MNKLRIISFTRVVPKEISALITKQQQQFIQVYMQLSIMTAVLDHFLSLLKLHTIIYI